MASSSQSTSSSQSAGTWQALPTELTQMIARGLNGREVAAFSRVDTQSEANVRSNRVDACRADSLLGPTYAASQPPEFERADAESNDQYWLDRAKSLTGKTEKLPCGAWVLERDRNRFDSAAIDPVVQRDLAERRWACKATAMMAFIRQVQGGEKYLSDKIFALSDKQKVEAMRAIFPKLHFPDTLNIVHLTSTKVRHPWCELQGSKQLVYLPAEIGVIQSRQFNLTNNKLNQHSFHRNGVPPRIEVLDVSYNELSQVPETIGKMVTLKRLGLASQRAPLKIPQNSPLFQLQNLVYLDLSSDNLTELPDEFQSLVNLKELSLYGNLLQDVPAVLACLPKLESLNLYKNPISFESLKAFVLLKEELGTERLRVSVDKELLHEELWAELIVQISERGNYTLYLAESPPALILEKRSSDIEMTQRIDFD